MDDSLDDVRMSPNSQDNSFLSEEEEEHPRDEFTSSLTSQPRTQVRLSIVRCMSVSIRPLKHSPIPSDLPYDQQAQESTIDALRRALSSQQHDLQLENSILREQLDRLRSELASETRIMSSEEVRKLRQTVEEKNKKIASLQRIVPLDAIKPTNLFAFLSSEQAQAWMLLCSAISQMTDACSARNAEIVAQRLDCMVELLDSKGLASSPAAETLAEVALNVSKALNQARIPWERVTDLVRKAQGVCQEEAQRLGRPEAPAPKNEGTEEYLSDFSDEDFSIEVEEEDIACQAVSKLQSALEKYQFSHSGPISPQGLFDILSLRVLDASESSLESFIRRLPFPSGTILFENFIKDMKTRSPQWWLKTLSASSFDLQHQVRQGTFIQHPAWTLWVQTRLKAKLMRYCTMEKVTQQEMIGRIFRQGRLAKRELRHTLRDLNFPLNREDCHSLFRLLDSGDGFASSSSLSDFLATQTPSPIPFTVTEELTSLSERDARFRLIQAEQRIADLEHMQVSISPNLTKEHTLTLQLVTLRKDFDLLSAQLDDARRQCQILQLEKEQLLVRLAAPHPMEYDMRRSEDALEDADKEFRCRLQTLTTERESALADQKRRHDEEKAGLLRLIKNKNRELDSLTVEVDRLLHDMEELKSRP